MRHAAPATTQSLRRVRLAQNKIWGISSAGRAVALQAIGQRFDPVILHHNHPYTRCTIG